jgi:hypothetical protein
MFPPECTGRRGAGSPESEDAVTENMKRILMVGVPLIAVAGVWRVFLG